jgi:predicted ATP-grasp superfamily ATP-dependent carboligase
VLVTDGEERSALAALRALSRSNFQVTVVSKTRFGGSLWSRSCCARSLGPDPKLDGESFVRDLAKILERKPHSVLLPGSEASLLAISEHRSLIEPLVTLGLPPHDDVKRSLDKILLMREARAVGLDPPPNVACAEVAEAVGAARELGYPVVVKPERSLLSTTEGLRQRPIAVVHDEPALHKALASIDRPFLVQQFMQAAGRFSAAGVMAGNGLLALAAARFDRTWPARAGAVAFGETVVPPSGLARKIELLLGRVGWSGIFELEYLELPHGRAAAIDLNPRVFGWLTLAVEAGANLPAVWCDWVLGRNPDVAIARPGVRYRWEEAELAHFFWQLRHGDMVAAARVARPRRHVVHAHFRMRDPAPLVAQTLRLGAAKLAALSVGRRASARCDPSSAAVTRSKVTPRLQ